MIFEKATADEMAKVGRRGAKAKWPLGEMSVGDAVTIENGQYGKSSPQNYPHTYGQKRGMTFSITKVSGTSYRIVRTS